MTTLPAAPYFIFHAKQHFIDWREAVETRMRVNRLAVLSEWDVKSVVYDSQATAWAFRFERPPNGFPVWTKILTHSFYNPIQDLQVTWTRLRNYDLEELRRAYLDAVAHDDDILTQFVEQDSLTKRINECRTFQGFLDTWKWMETDQPFDEEKEG